LTLVKGDFNTLKRQLNHSLKATLIHVKATLIHVKATSKINQYDTMVAIDLPLYKATVFLMLLGKL
jgi:hypothetical protein